MSKILVTGGAGYIGSVLIPMLLRAGHEVTALDSFLYRQCSLIDCCNYKSFNIVNGDCRSEETLKKLLPGNEFIIPLAAIVGFPACEKDETAAVSVNQTAVETLISLRERDQKIIFPCTNSGYGLGQGEEFCTETSPISPISLYGKTKMAAERAVLEAGNSVTFRFATLFGASPRMRTDLLVNDFVYRAVFDRSLIVFEGNFKRNYLHVRDAARAFMFAMDNFDKMNGQTYNCGLSSANLSKLQLCEKIKDALPSFQFFEAPVGSDPDKRDYIVSNAKIEALGYKPEFSLEDGIMELTKVYCVIKNSFYGNV
ncbi:MAG: NAD(P)-dependent oxidoreductase [Oscillospiraceae bacterium]|nr:NAD(P)-dependent oxidoreductase [Oscillospiraceae bacterium]